jgi:hypothetical protein
VRKVSILIFCLASPLAFVGVNPGGLPAVTTTVGKPPPHISTAPPAERVPSPPPLPTKLAQITEQRAPSVADDRRTSDDRRAATGDAADDSALPLTLDAGEPVTAEVGHRCIVAVKTKAKKVTWRVPSGVETISLDGKRLAVWAPVGVYTFRAMVPNGEDVLDVEIVLTVTGPRPPPPPTPPSPTPPAPTPPAPTPPAPTPPAPTPPAPAPPAPTPPPADPLVVALQGAYDASPDSDRADKLGRMIGFIEDVLNPPPPRTSALDTKTTTTTTALLTVLSAMRRANGLPDGAIEPVGTVIERALVTEVLGAEPGKPVTPTNLDGPQIDMRARFRAFFTKILAALKNVKR